MKNNFSPSTLLNPNCIDYRNYKVCVCVYTGKNDRTEILRIQEYKRNYKNGELKPKLVCHAPDTDHTPDF